MSDWSPYPEWNVGLCERPMSEACSECTGSVEEGMKGMEGRCGQDRNCSSAFHAFRTGAPHTLAPTLPPTHCPCSTVNRIFRAQINQTNLNPLGQGKLCFSSVNAPISDFCLTPVHINSGISQTSPWYSNKMPGTMFLRRMIRTSVSTLHWIDSGSRPSRKTRKVSSLKD